MNEVVARYLALGSRLHRSDHDGAVTITSRSGTALVKLCEIRRVASGGDGKKPAVTV